MKRIIWLFLLSLVTLLSFSQSFKGTVTHQLKQLTRKERTHRLCTRGGMLESFLQEPERLTDDDVMMLLKLIFHRQDTQELLKKLLERKKPETP